MSKTASAVPAAHVPGRYEAQALRFMHEWEPSSRQVGRHIVAQKVGSDAFAAFEWQAGSRTWSPWIGIHANAPRRAMIDAFQKEVGWANLTIMDEPVAFDDYAGIGPADFDGIVFCDPHVLLCPVGAPGGGDGWARVDVDRNGVGRPLGGGRIHPSHIADGPLFLEHTVAARFRKEALPVEEGPLGYRQAVRVPPVLLRHDRVMRQIVPKGGWGIVGRPDLLARQMDRELAINAAVEAEDERQRKAGEWRQPLKDIRHEIALRMEKEWAAQAA